MEERYDSNGMIGPFFNPCVTEEEDTTVNEVPKATRRFDQEDESG